MKKKRFSVEQIVAVLKQAELGVPVAEVIRKVGSVSRPFTDGRSSMLAWRRDRTTGLFALLDLRGGQE
jgi:putative transposase